MVRKKSLKMKDGPAVPDSESSLAPRGMQSPLATAKLVTAKLTTAKLLTAKKLH